MLSSSNINSCALRSSLAALSAVPAAWGTGPGSGAQIGKPYGGIAEVRGSAWAFRGPPPPIPLLASRAECDRHRGSRGRGGKGGNRPTNHPYMTYVTTHIYYGVGNEILAKGGFAH
jgi:hypothetical protein